MSTRINQITSEEQPVRYHRNSSGRIQFTEQEEQEFDQNKYDAIQRRIGPELQKRIHDHATQLIESVTPATEQLHTIMEGVLLTRKEQHNRANAQEIDKLDQLEKVATWIKKVRAEEKRFIQDDLPKFTDEQRLNLDPANDIGWPSLTVQNVSIQGDVTFIHEIGD